MKDSKVKVGKEVLPTRGKVFDGITKPTKKLWKRYFEKKPKQLPPHHEITDDNWWEFI